MSHLIYRIVGLEIVGPYRLRIQFNDGTDQTIDFKPILAGKIYGSLNDLDVFNQVRIDPEIHTVVWPNGADFDPATLHDWSEHESAWLAKVSQ